MNKGSATKTILVIIVIIALAAIVVWSSKTYFESFGTKEAVETGQSTINRAEDVKDQLDNRLEAIPGLE